jgi:hypothetical protein
LALLVTLFLKRVLVRGRSRFFPSANDFELRLNADYDLTLVRHDYGLVIDDARMVSVAFECRFGLLF